LQEGGPPPLKLSDGNYFFLYNSAQSGFPTVKPDWDLRYNMGYVILNGSNPSQILERIDANTPLFSPELEWEIGNSTDPQLLSLTPNVVFCEGLVAKPGAVDEFIFIYGAADSRVGVGTITVQVPRR
jgi:predicted GH43/DUF377 family glycosyl hydrolase